MLFSTAVMSVSLAGLILIAVIAGALGLGWVWFAVALVLWPFILGAAVLLSIGVLAFVVWVLGE